MTFISHGRNRYIFVISQNCTTRKLRILTLFDSSFTQPLGDRFSSVFLYVTAVARDWYTVLLPASLLGILLEVRSNKNKLVPLCILYCWLALGVLLFFVYVVDHKALFTIAIVERFYLLSYPFIFLTGAVFKHSFAVLVSGYMYKNAFISLMLILSLLLALKSLRFVSLVRTNNTVELFGRETLKLLPRNSILIVSADVYRFPLEYYSFVEHIRPDITVISTSIIGVEHIFQLNKGWMNKNRIITTYKPHSVHEFIKVNSKKRPLFITYDISNLDGLVQVGPLFQYRRGEYVPSIPIEKFRTYFQAFPSENKILNRNSLFMVLRTRAITFGKELCHSQNSTLKKDYANSLYFLKQAHRITSSKDTYLSLGIIKYKQGDCKGARAYWKGV